ncbi:phosphoadenylyl-sulfate reductase [Mycobacterium lepraemurium]|nr:phosphoadenylyl-sulfate reductase [Mycobacterium lepraemurium]
MSYVATDFTEEQLRELAERGASEIDILRWTDEHFGPVDGSPRLGHLQIRGGLQHAGRGDGAAGLRRAPWCAGVVPGHRLSLPRDHRHPRRRRGGLRHPPGQRHPREHRGRAGRAAGQGPVRPGPQRMLPAAQGRAAAKGAARLRGVWVSGLRRVEAPTRADAPLISFDESFKVVKVNPIAAWTDEQVDEYVERNRVLVNPLVQESYPSIGCAPCTAKPAPGEDPRSGRWRGRNKVECGLHAS